MIAKYPKLSMYRMRLKEILQVAANAHSAADSHAVAAKAIASLESVELQTVNVQGMSFVVKQTEDMIAFGKSSLGYVLILEKHDVLVFQNGRINCTVSSQLSALSSVQGLGMARYLYEYLVKTRGNLLSANLQTPAGSRIWEQLNSNVPVYSLVSFRDAADMDLKLSDSSRTVLKQDYGNVDDRQLLLKAAKFEQPNMFVAVKGIKRGGRLLATFGDITTLS